MKQINFNVKKICIGLFLSTILFSSLYADLVPHCLAMNFQQTKDGEGSVSEVSVDVAPFIAILKNILSDFSNRDDAQTIISHVDACCKSLEGQSPSFDSMFREVLTIMNDLVRYSLSLAEQKNISAHDQDLIQRSILSLNQIISFFESIDDNRYQAELASIKEVITLYNGKCEEDKNSYKAPREDAPSYTANNALVGAGCCDLTQVIALLSSIKKSIGKLRVDLDECCDRLSKEIADCCDELSKEITDCCTLLSDKFDQTWTILAALGNDVNDCCTTIYDDFRQTWTVLAGLDSDLNICCEDLSSKFDQTWTILANIGIDFNDCCTGITAGIDSIEGSIDGVAQDLTDCCTTLSTKFNETWTILANLDLTCTAEVDLSGVYTVLDNLTCACDLSSVYTVLDNLSCECDLSGVYTVLDNLTISCTAEVDLSGVYTVLDNLTCACDLSGVYTVLDTLDSDIMTKFNETWTILANLDLTCTAEVDLNSVFTVLAGIDQDIETCCDGITTKFNETWTILATLGNDFNDCCTTLNDQITDLDITINNKFNETWTVLAGIDQDIETCCDGITTKFNETWTALDACCEDLSSKFDQTWTILANLGVSCDLSGVYTAITACCENISSDLTVLNAAMCGPTIVYQTLFDAGTTVTLSSHGNYILGENITFSPASPQPAIEIIGSYITIDLCSHKLEQGNSTAGVAGIRVQGGAIDNATEDITIQNGTLGGFTDAGIVMGTNTVTPANTHLEQFYIKDVVFDECVFGITLYADSTAAYVGHGRIQNCDFVDCGQGASADYIIGFTNAQEMEVSNCTLRDCGTSSNNLIAVKLYNSSICHIDGIDMEGCTISTCTGILLDSSNANMITNCRISNNICNSLTGFVVEGSGTKGNEISNCKVRNNTIPQGPCIGFSLLQDIDRNSLSQCLVATNSVTGSGNCIGFNFNKVKLCSVNDCIARYNQTVSGTCVGFYIGSSAGNGSVGCYNCSFQTNVALSNNAATDANSFGFQVGFNGTDYVTTQSLNVFMGNQGILNGPITPKVDQQIVSDSPGDTPFSNGGVSSSSLTDLHIYNLNSGHVIMFTNFRIYN